jgi:hypothetical protein
MSDADMENPSSEQQTQAVKVKVATPDLFYGERAKLEPWLLQFDIYFHVKTEIEEENKVTLISSYLRGKALQWITPKLKRYFDNDVHDAALVKMIEDYDEFKEQIRKAFSIAKEPAIAEGVIQRLKQTQSVGDYANVFQQHSEHTEWNDKALMRMFRQGLKGRVRTELMRSGANITTLNDLIEEATRIDNDLYEVEIENRAFTTPRHSRERFRPTYKPMDRRPRGRFYPHTPGYHQAGGLESMDIDTIEHGKTHSSYKKPGYGNGKPSNQQETRTCYNCGKPGHIARNCRSKNKVIKRINMIEHGNTEGPEQEWEVVSNPNMGPDSPASESADELPTVQLSGMNLEEGNDQEPLIVRTPTPHPGTRVVTGWDNSVTKEPESPPYYRDNANQLWYTPPDSPTLQRENATVGEVWAKEKEDRCKHPRRHTHRKGCRNKESNWPQMRQQRLNDPVATRSEILEEGRYEEPRRAKIANDGQALLRQDDEDYDTPREYLNLDERSEEEDWVTKTTREYNATQRIGNDPANVVITLRPLYFLDPRNPLHEGLSWTACTYDECNIHYSEKEGSGYFPKRDSRCKWQWFDCPKVTCERHLWDKRLTQEFPGKQTDQDYALRFLLVNGNCCNKLWQLCLSPACQQHKEIKQVNGFWTNESFLETIPNPESVSGNATRSTQQHSTSSL